jgi:anti-anti-sigma factor
MTSHSADIDRGFPPRIEVLLPRPGAAVVECTGELDLTIAPQLNKELEELAGENELVVVDLSEAQFIDSSVVQCLASAHRRSRDKATQLRLQFGSAAIVNRAHELSGMLELLQVATTREEALAPRIEAV